MLINKIWLQGAMSPVSDQKQICNLSCQCYVNSKLAN